MLEQQDVKSRCGGKSAKLESAEITYEKWQLTCCQFLLTIIDLSGVYFAPVLDELMT